jgi:hypothetical protein
MSDDNKKNLQYFEGSTMRELYDRMEAWQNEHRKRFASASIQPDAGGFCCIALTNPTEVIITDGTDTAYVSSNNRLYVELP